MLGELSLLLMQFLPPSCHCHIQFLHRPSSISMAFLMLCLECLGTSNATTASLQLTTLYFGKKYHRSILFYSTPITHWTLVAMIILYSVHSRIQNRK